MSNTPGESGQISPDGMWRWDGTAWVPNQPGPVAGQPARPVAPQPVAPQYAQPQAPVQYAQPKKSHTGRNILLVILGVMVLAIGGCMAVVIGGANEVSKSIDESIAQDKEPGGPDNPMAIEVGKAFSVNDFDYQSGWTVGDDGFGDLTIDALKVENNRGEKDSAIVEIKFMKGTEVIALADCISDPIQPGQTVTLACVSTDPVPKKYDEVTINDTF